MMGFFDRFRKKEYPKKKLRRSSSFKKFFSKVKTSISNVSKKLRSEAKKVYAKVDDTFYSGFLPGGANAGKSVSRKIRKIGDLTNKVRDALQVNRERKQSDQIRKLRRNTAFEQQKTTALVGKEKTKISRDLQTKQWYEIFGGGKIERKLRDQQKKNAGATIQINLSKQSKQIKDLAKSADVADPYATLNNYSDPGVINNPLGNISSSLGKIAPYAIGAVGIALLLRNKKR